MLWYGTLIGWNINHKKMMENNIGDSLSVIEPCLDLPGALKRHFVDGGFSYGIYEQDKMERGDEEPESKSLFLT